MKRANVIFVIFNQQQRVCDLVLALLHCRARPEVVVCTLLHHRAREASVYGRGRMRTRMGLLGSKRSRAVAFVQEGSSWDRTHMTTSTVDLSLQHRVRANTKFAKGTRCRGRHVWRAQFYHAKHVHEGGGALGR